MVASQHQRIVWTKDEQNNVAVAMLDGLVADPKLSLLGALALAQCAAVPAHRQKAGLDSRYLQTMLPHLLRLAKAGRKAGRPVPAVLAGLLPPDQPETPVGPGDAATAAKLAGRIDRICERVDRLGGMADRQIHREDTLKKELVGQINAQAESAAGAVARLRSVTFEQFQAIQKTADGLAAQLREKCDDDRGLRERMDRLEQDLKAAVGLIEELADRGPASRPAAAPRPSGEGQDVRAGNGRAAVKLPTFWVPGARSETLQRLALHFKGRAVIDGPGTNDNRRATCRVRSADYYVLPLKWCGSEVWQAVKEYLGEQYPAAEQAGRVMVLDPRAGGDTVIQEAIENALAVNGRA